MDEVAEYLGCRLVKLLEQITLLASLFTEQLGHQWSTTFPEAPLSFLLPKNILSHCVLVLTVISTLFFLDYVSFRLEEETTGRRVA